MQRISVVILLILLNLGCWAEAVTRYIDTSCSTISTYNPGASLGNRCTGGSALSYATSSAGQAALLSGDVLYYRAGNYGGFNAPPSGTGANGRTVISAYPINRTCSGHNPADVRTCVGSTYEPVTLTRSGGAVIQIRGAGAVPGPIRDPKWITVEGIIVDATGSGDNGITITGGGTRPDIPPACTHNAQGPASHGYNTTPDHLRFLNMEVRKAPNQGMLGEDYNENIEIIGSWFHHNGSDFNTDHGVYIAGTNNWLYGNIIENNKAYGLHIYAQPKGTPTAPECDPFGAGAIIENNIFRGNRDAMMLGRGNGDMTVRNNLVYGNSRIGIHMLSSSSTLKNKIYNNTLLDGQHALYVGPTTYGVIIRNNIYQKYYQDPAENPADVTASNNYHVCAVGCASPDFVNAGGNDYRLRAGDARINAGVNLTSEGVTIDFAGNARPAGGQFDIGAYEHDAAGPPVQTFDFSVANEGEQTVAQGASVVNTITLTTEAGTATTVTLTAEGLPSNATASFAAASCTPNCTSDLTIDTANTTPEGTYVITVRGSTGGGGIGNIQRVSTFNLVVSCN